MRSILILSPSNGTKVVFQIGISHQIRLDVIWFAFPNSHIVDNTTIAQWVKIFYEGAFIFFFATVFFKIFSECFCEENMIWCIIYMVGILFSTFETGVHIYLMG